MKNISRAILLLNIIFLVIGDCTSQFQTDKSIAFNYKYGLLVTHREEIPNSIRNLKPKGFDALISFQTKGSKAWQQHWDKPNYGFSIGFFNLDQPDVLGNVIYATCFLEKPLLKTSNRHQLRYRVAPGLSYSNVVYDASNNPDNILISLPVNFIMEGSLMYQYMITKRWALTAGVYLTHYSNGAFRFPNIGVNIPSFNIGLRYQLERSGDIDLSDEGGLYPFEKSFEWQLIAAASLKSAGEEYDDLDLAYTISINRVWKLKPRYSLLGALDFMYNGTVSKVLYEEEANPYRLGIAGGIQFELGLLAFNLQAGVYVYRPEKELDEAIYLRWGFKREIGRRLLINLMLKTHYARADLVELGIGYILN